MASALRPTIFLDRDGVINERAPHGEYITSWPQFRFVTGAVDALARIRRRRPDIGLIVVTNQRGVGLGLVSRPSLDEIHHRMGDMLRDKGAALDAVYVCPHVDESCGCRKPGIGLISQAYLDHDDIDRSRSVLVGDSVTDAIAAYRAGMPAFLVGDGARATVDVPVAGRATSLQEVVDSGVLDRYLDVGAIA